MGIAHACYKSKGQKVESRKKSQMSNVERQKSKTNRRFAQGKRGRRSTASRVKRLREPAAPGEKVKRENGKSRQKDVSHAKAPSRKERPKSNDMKTIKHGEHGAHGGGESPLTYLPPSSPREEE